MLNPPYINLGEKILTANAHILMYSYIVPLRWERPPYINLGEKILTVNAHILMYAALVVSHFLADLDAT